MNLKHIRQSLFAPVILTSGAQAVPTYYTQNGVLPGDLAVLTAK